MNIQEFKDNHPVVFTDLGLYKSVEGVPPDHNDDIFTVWQFVEEAHKGQVRKFNGEPYANHPIRVSKTIRKFTTNIDIEIAAMLHDVIEDTEYVFGYEVSTITNGTNTLKINPVILQLVSELTNVYTKEKFPDINRKTRKKMEFDRLRYSSWSARLIKMADRLDNIQSFAKDDPKFSIDYYYVQETFDLLDAIMSYEESFRILCKEIIGVIENA